MRHQGRLMERLARPGDTGGGCHRARNGVR
jgi:hypothetical protein